MDSNAPTKVVLITGAAGGLGRALVDEFISHRWRIVVASRRANAFEASEHLWPLALDVRNAREANAAAAAIVERWQRIDCLVNNAGTTADALLIGMRDEQWDQAVTTNLSGAFNCARAVSRHMAKQRDGHVINMSSFAGRAGAAGRSNYAAAKAGLIGLTQSIAKELGTRNVRANVVLPGVLPTKMTAALSGEQMKNFAAANALGRINSLDEVARFVVFLAGTQNISGQIFQLDSRIAAWT